MHISVSILSAAPLLTQVADQLSPAVGLRHGDERLVTDPGLPGFRIICPASPTCGPPIARRGVLQGRPDMLRHALSGPVLRAVHAQRPGLRLELPDRRMHQHAAEAALAAPLNPG